MALEASEKIKPVCKFGPGGDFVWHWPGQFSERSEVQPSRLGRIFNVLSEIIKQLRGTEIEVGTAESAQVQHNFSINCNLQNTDRSNGPCPGTDHPKIRIIRTGSGLSSQSLLFPDDWRAGGKVMHKPKHRIRTYKAAAGKSSAFRAPRQDTLFETDRPSARIA